MSADLEVYATSWKGFESTFERLQGDIETWKQTCTPARSAAEAMFICGGWLLSVYTSIADNDLFIAHQKAFALYLFMEVNDKVFSELYRTTIHDQARALDYILTHACQHPDMQEKRIIEYDRWNRSVMFSFLKNLTMNPAAFSRDEIVAGFERETSETMAYRQ